MTALPFPRPEPAAAAKTPANAAAAVAIDPKKRLADPQSTHPLDGDDRTVAALPAATAEAAAPDKCAAALEVIRRMAGLSERRSPCSPALFAIRPTVLKHMGKKNAPRRLDEAVRLLDATFASALQLLGRFPEMPGGRPE